MHSFDSKIKDLYEYMPVLTKREDFDEF
ncbi:MAG: hypothetical protein K0R46_1759, partial [Herbinix sp.]|nr:hypothetical protein [Herbinix sp.]